jgi:amidase
MRSVRPSRALSQRFWRGSYRDRPMTGDLHNIELMELAARIRAGDVSPVAVTRAQLDRIAALDGKLASYALVMADVAMAQAEAAEAEIAAGRYRGPLHGVPIAVKDLLWTKGVPTASCMATKISDPSKTRPRSAG